MFSLETASGEVWRLLQLVYAQATGDSGEICIGLSWISIMGMTLNELAQLKDKGFGKPYPRHGLNLLYWFANECIDIDTFGRLVPKFNLTHGVYGFHRFHNRIDDEETPLPNQNIPKYEVGNLSAPGADKLPWYVRENYSRDLQNSNMDRIIVCLNDSGYLERVYIAEHTTQTNFSRSRTYRVSQGLLKIIRNLQREDFLKKMKPTESPPENNSWCIIL
ncbi:uncharacterized protein LOC143494210 [Brachyhypopomus gauderio]|uniref:uncharacterized protein LOC143494210 n=1 Tax=Brachyhypopomus gauderio TaxID=698409 RepID=UPI004042B58D